MKDYSKTVVTDKLVNLTGHPVNIYDEFSGKIKSFDVSDEALPVQPQTRWGGAERHYICSKQMVAELKDLGRDLDDIVVEMSESPGRHHKKISRLVWGEDMETQVCFRADAPRALFNHL